MKTAEAYATRGLRSVEGWFSTLDAKLFLAVDEVQRAEGTRGDLLEVGAFLGRSAILLGFLARHGEILKVVDLFGDAAGDEEQKAEQRRWYQDLTRARFERNYLRFHAALPQIHQGPSKEFLAETPEGSCRFIHIDGSHEFEAVRADAAAALRIASPGAIIVFDDIVSVHTPGVTAAVWELILGGYLLPLVQTSKLYTTLATDSLPLEMLAHEIFRVGVDVVERHHVAGHPILEVSERPTLSSSVRTAVRNIIPRRF